MKKILNFLKALLFGIYPTICGVFIGCSTYYVIKHLRLITTGSGWSVVWHFLIAIIEAFCVIFWWYELGTMCLNARKWNLHKKEISADTIDGSSEDCKTSDESTDITCDCE
jgi:hypothetical protein